LCCAIETLLILVLVLEFSEDENKDGDEECAS
jgi:hypothetical protein